MVSRHRVVVRTGCTMLALAVFCAVTPDAFAQGYYSWGSDVVYEPEPLISPRSVVFRLQDRGFSDVTRPRFDGTAYIVDATDPAGIRVRLFVDARSGGMIGRRRLEGPIAPPPARVARTAPGYGWTDDDTAAPGRLMPPADIPSVAPARPRPPQVQANIQPALPSRGVDDNPLGVNPDARGRAAEGHPAAPARKTARLAPAPKSLPKAVPETVRPATPSAASADKTQAPPAAGLDAKIDAKPEAKPDPAPQAPVAATETKPAKKPEPAPTTPAALQAENGKAPGWQDPPASDASSDGSKRNVRVIGGATVVPGSGESAPAGGAN